MGRAPQKITKKAFLAAAKKGWEKLKFRRGLFWASKSGTGVDSRDAVYAACAIGAAAYAMRISWRTLAEKLHKRGLDGGIISANDASRSKSAALRAISKLKWTA